MNIFKSSILTLVSFGMATTFVACSDDDDVNVTGDVFDIPGAYFKPQYDSELTVGETDTEFIVTVYRADGEGASSANLTSTIVSTAENASTAFDVPAQVLFADGETSSSFTVKYTATELEPVVPYEITISIVDGKDTPYSSNTVKYTVTYVPWNDLGECDYTDFLTGVFFNVPDYTYKVSIQEHPTKQGLYRLKDPYGDAFPLGIAHYDDSSIHYLYINACEPTSVYFADRDGNPAHFVTGATLNSTYGELIGSTIATLRLMQGRPDDAEGNYGELVNGCLYMPNVLAAMRLYNDAGLYSREIDPGNYMVILPGASKPEETWTELGNGQYTDAFVSPLYEIESTPYTVKVEQSDLTGVIRIQNPYTNAFPDGEPSDTDYYITFDISNPDCVVVVDQETGIVDEEDGPVHILNYAGYLKAQGASDSYVIEKGLNDTFADNVVTIGKGHALAVFPSLSEDEQGPYIANKNVEGKLVLPAAVSAAAVKNVAARKQAAAIAKFNFANVKPSFTPLENNYDESVRPMFRKLSIR
ncbi:hypothetical protein [uncultured Duncaniella sp.]|uniref:hypothetical protein n=1 Tax=uncultured Duncaniella sp. TaxID=2768039 RepID=UPI00260E1ED0|nr:hypothetical protein [uncultured Duncaniella sp.]